MGWIILWRRWNVRFLFIFNTDNVVDTGGPIKMRLEYCTDRVLRLPYLLRRYTSTETMDGILIRLQLLCLITDWNVVVASCRFCESCMYCVVREVLYANKSWRRNVLHWQWSSMHVLKDGDDDTENRVCVVGDEWNQKKRGKNWKKNWGNHLPPILIF